MDDSRSSSGTTRYTDMREFGPDLRRGSQPLGERPARARLDAANLRDALADARDAEALVRDRAAAARDLAMDEIDSATWTQKSGLVDGVRSPRLRRRIADNQALATEYRAMAARCRAAAAADRESAARERSEARADRETLARLLTIAETDSLTGARARGAGLTDLDHEIDRARRAGAPLVVAYVDIVGLKQVNDSAGHGAGDELLKHVVKVMKSHLRSYDLVIRLGGDEFLCVMSRMTLADAHRRFDQICTVLAPEPEAPRITTGFAEFAPGDTATELIARADSELLHYRGGA